jgi:DNA-binding transcriptional LysR family regulator
MDPQRLRVFLAVADELHFARAAERLHMAQPPVSRSIQQLERELGVQLFERSTRKVTLTSAGDALIAPAKEAIDALERVKTVARAAGVGEIGRVRLAYAGASSNVMVGRLARAVKQGHPGIQLELLSRHFGQPAMRLLTGGDVDLAIGWWDHVPSEVQTRVIAVEALAIAVPETHRFARRDRVSIRDFEGEPFVSLSPETGTPLLERLAVMTRSAGFVADIVQYAPDSWSLMSLVSAEVGCALTLTSVVTRIADPHLRVLPLSDAGAPAELRLAWRAESDDRALRAVLRLADSVLPTPRSA